MSLESTPASQIRNRYQIECNRVPTNRVTRPARRGRSGAFTGLRVRPKRGVAPAPVSRPRRGSEDRAWSEHRRRSRRDRERPDERTESYYVLGRRCTVELAIAPPLCAHTGHDRIRKAYCAVYSLAHTSLHHAPGYISPPDPDHAPTPRSRLKKSLVHSIITSRLAPPQPAASAAPSTG